MGARIVLFDLGNVVIDWDPRRLYTRRFGDSEKADWFCNTICTMEWHLRHDAGESFDVTIPELQARHPQYRLDIAAWRDEWLDMFYGYVPGTPLIMAELESRKIPLYGLSNISHEVTAQTFAAFPMIKILRDIVVSGEERLIKPDPRIYEIAHTRMGQPDPDSVLFVDDSAKNIVAAEAFGFRGHVFAGAGGLRERLEIEGLL